MLLRLIFLMAMAGAAQAADAPTPFLAHDFAGECAAGRAPDLSAWRVSGGLDPALRALRLRCAAEALRIDLHPGDAHDPNPGGNPTERVELQARQELVRFGQPVWYAFRFRLVDPWLPAGAPLENRTVIHQVKQNIVPEKEIAHGGFCPSANPFFKIEAGYRAATQGPGFVVKTRGTGNCLDGKAGETVCGPWALQPGKWHQVHVALKATQEDGKSDLRVWLDGRPCMPFTGRLGYSDHGKRTADGRPHVDGQPRFGIYRDVLPEKLRAESIQSIEFAGIAFWDRNPAGHPAWNTIGLATAP